jgi:glycosyltransferase involved in cell wall biosynthesis
VTETSRKGRVAFIAGEYPKPSETFLLRELRGLKARGLDFVIVATKRLDDAPEAAGIDAPVILRPSYFSWAALSAEVRFAFTHPLRYLAILSALYRGHWRRIDDAVQVMQNVPRALAVGYELRRLGVTRVHALWASLPATIGWIIARAFGMEFSFAAHARDVFVEGRMLREKAARAAFAVVCNRAAADRLREAVGARLAGRVALIHHGLDRAALPRRAAGEGFLLAAGRLERKKGFDRFILACAELARENPAIRGVIAGDGPERERLEKLIAETSAPVEIRGWMRHDALMDLLSRAEAVVVPSIMDPAGDRDGIPNVVLEAMAIGVPVIASDAGSLAEVVINGETGWLVPSGDAAALATAAREALADPTRADKITARASVLIDREFALETTLSELEQQLRRRDG